MARSSESLDAPLAPGDLRSMNQISDNQPSKNDGQRDEDERDEDERDEDERDAEDEDEPRAGGFIWQIVPVLMAIIMALLAMSLYRRVAQVDPVRRCADAFESSYNPTDTMLADRIKVRTPDRSGHTTCGELRASGAVQAIPKRSQMKKTMPS